MSSIQNDVNSVVKLARESLQPGSNPEREKRILNIGLLTGLHFRNGQYRKANFERGLLLDSLVTSLRPQNILELGTGRGLGAFAMAAAARECQLKTNILTVDTLHSETRFEWPIERDGRREVLKASRHEIWKTPPLNDLRSCITELQGETTSVLPRLWKEGRKFDFIFIDAGHDLFSVVHDLSYCVKLLAPEGWILMDDYAPGFEYGIGTCMAFAHARKIFQTAEVLTTEGTVFEKEEIPGLPRGMVLLGGATGNIALNPTKLIFWRLAGNVVSRCYRPKMFPLQGT